MSGILVTGISGFIGGYVWSILSKREDVWGVHGATGSLPLNPDRQLGLDLSKPAALAGLVEDIAPDVILHLAALARPEIVRRHSLLAWKVNNAATRELADVAEKLGSRLIFTSTDQVFDGSHGNYHEGDPPSPVNVYGETKKAAERAVLSKVENGVVVRLNNTYGPPRFHGSSFSEWILNREGNSETITLFLDQYRSPLDVVTAANALVELIDHSFTGILHLGGANRINRVNFGKMLLQHVGRDQNSILELHSAKVDPEGKMPLDTSFDITLAKQMLRTPIPNLLQGLEQVYGPARAKY
ncbi:SDR family oxidoreductase [bacterium]|nr:SDR family oxidoreductase [bacterium]